MLYSLVIVKAHPDYKRPYSTTDVYYFLNPGDANEKRREEKRSYYQDFLKYLEEEDIDKIDEDDLQSEIYADSYMDMEPFSAQLYEINIENDTIVTKKLRFPNDVLEN